MIEIIFDGRVWNVYERKDEVPKDIEVVVDVMDWDVGKYVLCANGYYVPVISRHKCRRKLQNKEAIWVDAWLTTFPHCKHTTYIYPNGRVAGKRRILFEMNYYQKQLREKDKTLWMLIKSGMNLAEAWEQVFKSSLKEAKYRALAKLHSPAFLELMEKDNMGLKEDFENEGIDGSYVAQEIKKVIDNPRNSNDRRWGLEKAIEILNAPEAKKALPMPAMMFQQNNIDKAIMGNIPNQLNE